jgi:hypothetical protein
MAASNADEFLAALSTSALEHLTTVAGLHSLAEPVGPLALNFRRLVRPLHSLDTPKAGEPIAKLGGRQAWKDRRNRFEVI